MDAPVWIPGMDAPVWIPGMDAPVWIPGMDAPAWTPRLDLRGVDPSATAPLKVMCVRTYPVAIPGAPAHR
jgi:hypothetical protein